MINPFARLKTLRLLWAGLFMLGAIHYVVFAQQSDYFSASESELITDDLRFNIHGKSSELKLIREGTVFKSQSCEFRLSENRVLMLIDGGTRRFFCLENLNLERVVKVLRENQFMNFWTVDFVVTEYENENFVLINRAILNSSANNLSKDFPSRNPLTD